MTTALGSSAQLMIGRESAFGTPVTPDLAYPFTGEGLDPGQAFIRSEGLRSDTGRGYTAAGRIAGRKNASAQTTVEIFDQGFGAFLQAMLSDVTTSQPNAGASPATYEHLFVPAPAMGQEIWTLETGWQDDADDEYSKRAVSAMVNTAEINVSADAIATANIAWLAQTVTTHASRTAATYLDDLAPLGGGAAALTIGGVSGDGLDCKITINNNLDGDRYYLGGAGQRKQPIAGRFEVTAEVGGDFSNWTAFNRVLNNTYTELELTLTGPLIEDAYYAQLVLTMNVATVGDPPSISGPGRIGQPLKFEAYDDGTGPGSIITALYRSTDETPVP